MAKSLRLGQVRLPLPQLLRQLFLLGNVHCSADEALENCFVENRNANAADMPQRAVWPNDALLDIATRLLCQHSFNGLRHEPAVLRVNSGEVFSECGCALRRIKTIHLEQFRRPVAKKPRGVEGPASRVGKPLSFTQVELASSQGLFRLLSILDVDT